MTSLPSATRSPTRTTVSGRQGSLERETSIEADMDPRSRTAATNEKGPRVIREPSAFVTAKLSLVYSVVDVRAPGLPVVNQ
jgi:hypothetical protein